MRGRATVYKIGRAFMHAVVFLGGLAAFVVTRKTPLPAAISMRRLFVLTNGRSNDVAGKVSGLLHRPYEIPRARGVLGELSQDDARRAADLLKRDGFVVFDTRLDPETCDEIAAFTQGQPADLVPPPEDGPAYAPFDPAAPRATRYQFREEVMMRSPVLRRLAVDESMLVTAQAYLGCQPVNDLMALWWSVPHGGPSSEAAQLYHFDMDRLRFVKFFIYLTDVGPDNGPHCYVRGSHVRKPPGLLRDGRISDEEIDSYYSSEEITEICGQKGTIVAVDTRGWHKGKAPSQGHRLIFQVEYSNSLFGVGYERLPVGPDWDRAVVDLIRRYPFAYQRFSL